MTSRRTNCGAFSAIPCATMPPSDQPSPSTWCGPRDQDSVHLVEIGDVVRRWGPPGDVDFVIASADESVIVNIERLFGAVGGDVVGISHMQAVPPLAVFGPGLAVVYLHAGQREV